jgi:hypothetical protein
MDLILIYGILGWFVFLYMFKTNRFVYNNRGGGEKSTVIQTPTTPAPSASESAADIYRARLQYDPLVAQQEMDIQRTLLPQQAALYQSLYNQYYPEIARQQQALQQELYPYQSQIVESGAQRALERLQNPNYMTTQEQTALDATRTKAVSDLQKSMRERANLSGGLYGGRSAASEAQSVSDLLNQFSIQDYTNRMQNAYNAQQALAPYMSILYPQVGATQPQYSPYQYQSAVPSPNSLYNAMFQASQPNYLYQQRNPSPLWGLGGQALGAGAMLGSAAMLASSIRYKKNIKPYGESIRFN